MIGVALCEGCRSESFINCRSSFVQTKCKHMEIGRKNNIGENEHIISNNVKHSLVTTDKQTDLVEIIDLKVSFHDHINQVVNKATNMPKLIQRTFNQFLDTLLCHYI